MITSVVFRKSLTSVFATLLLLVSFQASAKDPIYTSFFSDVAVSGYDAVAYFTENKAVEGNSDYKTKYQGAEWHFKSAENLAAFKSSPEKYAPQYGGYCAWAAAENKIASGDPEQWTIHDGKLYLNYDADVQSNWLKDKVGFIKKADANWPALIN